MAYLTMKQLLESGVHFGHQTKRWNPKMKPYIFGARNGIYIIDLQQTVKFFREAHDIITRITSKGGHVLFVGTKKQAQSAVEEEAKKCRMSFVNQRWRGGLLTNFSTIKKGIERLKELDGLKEKNYAGLSKKEASLLDKMRAKLEKSLGGIRNMNGLPDAVFVIDTKKEAIAVQEARRLGVPLVGIVDTNCDPEEVDYAIPGNDDAIRAIKLFASAIADACIDGRKLYEEGLQAASDKAAEKAKGLQEAAI
ncbi:MAG: 30S ribosomal protein S2 [Deltaproteobacteria bacterium]|nr:30S ribosomal protein S2 [Deltaproteobacteria bacterium]